MKVSLKAKIRLIILLPIIFFILLYVYTIKTGNKYADVSNYDYYMRMIAEDITRFDAILYDDMCNIFYILNNQDKHKADEDNIFGNEYDYDYMYYNNSYERDLGDFISDIHFFMRYTNIERYNTYNKNIFNEYLELLTDYSEKRENRTLFNLNQKDLISYYMNTSEKLLEILEVLEKISISDVTTSFIKDYISLHHLIYSLGAETYNTVIVSTQEEFNQEAYNNILSSAENIDKYIQKIKEQVEKYNQFKSVAIKELDTINSQYIKDFQHTLIDSKKNGTIDDIEDSELGYMDILSLYLYSINEMNDALYDFINTFDVSMHYFDKSKKLNVEDVTYIAYLTVGILFFGSLGYFLISIVFWIYFMIPNINLKSVRKYLQRSYLANKDMNFDASVVLGDKIGNIGKLIIALESVIIQVQKENINENKKVSIKK